MYTTVLKEKIMFLEKHFLSFLRHNIRPYNNKTTYK